MITIVVQVSSFKPVQVLNSRLDSNMIQLVGGIRIFPKEREGIRNVKD